MYLLLMYCITTVVYRLYEMWYPCSCNVVISCWKSGAYGIVICRGGIDMCFVSGSGWKHLDLEQYRILGLIGGPTGPGALVTRPGVAAPPSHLGQGWPLSGPSSGSTTLLLCGFSGIF